MFLMTILGVTDKRAPKGFVPITIGFTHIHFISIPVINTSPKPLKVRALLFFKVIGLFLNYGFFGLHR